MYSVQLYLVIFNLFYYNYTYDELDFKSKQINKILVEVDL